MHQVCYTDSIERLYFLTRQLHIIDTLGPFFIDIPDRKTINWSKVIFSDLEVNSRLSSSTQKQIIANFELYIEKVSCLGYDSISIDDLAHLVIFPFYNQSLQALLTDYQNLYKQLFRIAKSHNMHIFVNTDYLFFNSDIKDYLSSHDVAPDDFYMQALEYAIKEFSEIDGVILRVGEKDGKDVSGTFLSQLLLKTPAQANRLIKKILPLFEQHNKTLIFRTWTIGAYKIGDLIWNEKTYDAVFSSIKSDALVISMKFGDTDFMRYLTLNPLFFRGSHKKIIELQTRREWEGMGTFPSFVGWDYSHYLEELSQNENIIGIHVWCQTGGWAKKAWTNLTYLENSSFWNELNTEVTIDIARNHLTVEESIGRFCERRLITNPERFIELLRYADVAIKKGLYISELAEMQLYFRRTRIPPLMWLTWDNIHVPPMVVYLHRVLLPRNNRLLSEGDEAINATEKMIEIAHELQLNKKVLVSLEFEYATMIILKELRRYIHKNPSQKELTRINRQITTYKKDFPQHYSIPKLVPVKQRRLPHALLRPFLRESLSYRKRDKVFLKTSPVQARLVRYYLRLSKSRLENQSMGFEMFFK